MHLFAAELILFPTPKVLVRGIDAFPEGQTNSCHSHVVNQLGMFMKLRSDNGPVRMCLAMSPMEGRGRFS